MSDRDLRNLYEGVRRGDEYVAPRCENELYEDVLKEQYLVSIQDADGNLIYKSTIEDDDKVNKIRKDLDRAQKVKVGRESLTVYDMVDRVLDIDGWKQSNKNYKDQIYEPVKRAIHSVDINRDKFGGILKLQKDKNNPFRTKLLSNPGIVMNFIDDLISPTAMEMFATPQDAVNVLNTVWNLDTKISGISVGKGEICISLFSDAVKGAKGDLQLPGVGEVELKGTGARVGGDGYAHINSVPALDKILTSRKVKINDYQLNQVKTYAIESVKKLAGVNASTERKNWVTKLSKVVNNIVQDTDLKSIEKDVMGAVKMGIVPSEKSVKPILTALENYAKRAEGRVGGVFRGAVNTFFRTEWNLADDEILAGLLECRSTKDADINSLRGSLYQLIQQVNIMDDDGPTSNLARCLAAIHLSCYQRKEKFPYIVLSNDKNKNMIAIDFAEGESQGDVMRRMFDLFVRLNIKINLAVDEKMKSTGLTLP
jgi:hypothetical protein